MGRAKVAVKVWGDYACFSRPEFKVERVSYPVITPSAARGVLEAIFWKPEIRYEVTAIGVLKLGSMMVVLRNELGRRQGKTPYFIEDALNSVQSHSRMYRTSSRHPWCFAPTRPVPLPSTSTSFGAGLNGDSATILPI